LSYYVPDTYFANIPQDQRPHDYTKPMNVPACNNMSIPPENLNAYEFQTEQFLSSTGLNLYDGAVWSIATTLLGQPDVVKTYQSDVLLAHHTLQLGDIKADAACKGIMADKQCSDPEETGVCGFCYGVDSKTIPTINTYFFRMVSDFWSYEGTLDARCPTLGKTWTWSDWRPVTGENAWANLLGPLQVAYLNAKGNVNQISDDSVELTLATNIIPAIQAMVIPDIGSGATPVFYAPYNTFDVYNSNIGATVSIENNASLLAGLKALLYILKNKQTTKYANLIPVVQNLVTGITNFLKLAYEPSVNYFRQGGTYNHNTKTWDWGSGVPLFAVDCQTWVISVLGAPLIDSWFGSGTTFSVWSTTKALGGYLYNTFSGRVQGVGFANNSGVNVLSGEWSLGAVNMANILIKQYADNSNFTTSLQRDVSDIRFSVENRLTSNVNYKNGTSTTAVNYSNIRYFIPFGWWANPIPSMASTGWAVLVDKGYNPFVLGGGFQY